MKDGYTKPTKQQAIKMLKAIKRVFDSYNVEFVLVQGLALGYARYKDIMEWDADDFDLGVFMPVHILTKKEILRESIKQILYLLGSPKEFKENVSLCIKYWIHKKDYFEYKGGNHIFREHEKWFLHPQRVKFLGTTFLIPDKIEDYLDNHYGKGWETNIIKDVNDWLDEHDKHPEKYPWPITKPIKQQYIAVK